ncbi:DUF6266 family protein [Pedobacter sp. MC2016-14]|uniref:DUF6266 family protein n=1 Tax=Pedobacter sp. MC2016-14 TaxID=2897327 RepID=UPI001E3EEFCC|nr:DUF6266 family protein [Pedobacter sp. MC2016-14]MCD0490561.1 DUF6266 family protein [Pedobacter sp. MC2016-14]
MGIQHWGAFGGFVKKTGALVGHYLNGQNVITAVPHPSQEPPSTKQLAQRGKFGLVTGFLSDLSDLVKIGFKNSHKRKETAMNAAVSYNLKNAVTGVAPDFEMDYARVVYSKGKVDKPASFTVVAVANSRLTLSWTESVLSPFGKLTDLATFVVYNPLKDMFMIAPGVVARSVLTYNMVLPHSFAGADVHVFMTFAAADGESVSDNVYMGTVEVL